jgi:hypothetical protein
MALSYKIKKKKNRRFSDTGLGKDYDFFHIHGIILVPDNL